MISSIPRRLTGLDQARDRFGTRADRLAPFYMRGDPLAEAASQALVQLERRQADSLLDRALRLGIDRCPDAPAPVAALFRHIEHVPLWVDHGRCQRGGQAFFRAGALGGLVLGFGALARSYCSAGGNKPIAFTGDLVRRTPQRLAETADFVSTVCAPGSLRPGGRGLAAALHVRLLHARIRLALLKDPRFEVEDWGLPINQADTAVTALLFSHALARGVRRLGGSFSARDQSDLEHLWRYAGYLLGVEAELLCATTAEARGLADLVDQMDAGPDEDSRRLIGAMLDPVRMEQRLGSASRARAVRRVQAAVCRLLLGPALADGLGLAPDPVADGLLRAVRPGVRAASLSLDAVTALWGEARSRRVRRGAEGWAQFVASVPGSARFSAG